MSTNCLVTKLNGTVSDESIPKIGELVIKSLDYENALEYFNVTNGIELKKEYGERTGTITSDGKYVKCKKNILVNFGIGNSVPTDTMSVNLDDLKYCENLMYVNIIYQTIVGKPSNLPSSIHILMLSYTEPYVLNLSDITHLTSLTNIHASHLPDSRLNMKVTGSIEEFVTGQIQNGRTECSGINIGIKNIAIYTNMISWNGGYINVPSKVSWTQDDSDYNLIVDGTTYKVTIAEL